jgi:glycosyltransferase involved in cell wall biosynthesis
MSAQMDADDLVSVVIPAYNAERWIAATLASALAQTYRNLEIVVVDDGSTDKTSAIAEAFAARDPRVRVIHQTNRGLAAARNTGIAASRGSLIAPLDADDLWHPEKTAKQVAVMREAGPRVGVVYSWYSIIDESDRVIARALRPHHQGDIYAALVVSNFISSASIPLIRRSCLLELGGYDASLRTRGAQGCEDWKLYLAIAERYEFLLVPEYLVGYRRHPGSMSRSVLPMKRGHAEVLAEARQRHPELPTDLFRRSKSEFCYWSGLYSLRNGQIRQGLFLTVSIWLNDPLFPLRPLFRQGLARAVRNVARRLGIVEKFIGRPFLELPPW